MIFEHSLWWVFPALAVSAAVAYLKYRKLAKLPDVHRAVRWGASLLRFLVVFTLSLLLLNPALSLVRRLMEKPLLIVAQDNSASIGKGKDSLYYREEYPALLARAVTELRENFEVEVLLFGGEVGQGEVPDFTEGRTDLSKVLEYAARNDVARTPAGMVLLTDGIYNSGVNPRYGMPGFPVYPVLLGDTVAYPDLYIRSLEADKFNFLHSIFPVKVEVGAVGQKGERVKCVLRQEGKVLDERVVAVDREHFLADVVFEVEAKRKGVTRYEVTLESAAEERTVENNRAETWIHILDNTANVAIFSAAPHPDVAAVAQAVDASGIYRSSLHDFTESADTLKADLLVLHNPRSGDAGYRRLMEMAAKRKLSVWYLLTTPQAITDFARYGRHYSADFPGGMAEEYVTPAVNPHFPYFEFIDAEAAGFAGYPPVLLPFGTLNTGAGRVLFTQKIKGTATANGLLTFYEQEGVRTAYFWGEGLWRWRLYSYRETGSHELFNTLVNKTVGYLASQKGNERLMHDFRPVYDEAEEMVLNVELYNDSYERVNTPDMHLKLSHDGKDFDYLLNRNGDKYRLRLGNLASGEYAFRLSADLKGQKLAKKGTFYVRSNNLEWNDLVANAPLLREMAPDGVSPYIPSELDRLVKVLKDSSGKPVYKTETRFTDLTRVKWLGLLLLLLLCLEWFLLKYYAE